MCQLHIALLMCQQQTPHIVCQLHIVHVMLQQHTPHLTSQLHLTNVLCQLHMVHADVVIAQSCVTYSLPWLVLEADPSHLRASHGCVITSVAALYNTSNLTAVTAVFVRPGWSWLMYCSSRKIGPSIAKLVAHVYCQLVSTVACYVVNSSHAMLSPVSCHVVNSLMPCSFHVSMQLHSGSKCIWQMTLRNHGN